jgi:hypothetical protein
MQDKRHAWWAKIVYRLKALTVRIGLLALAVAFELASVLSRRVRQELSYWPDGLTFAMGVLPNGPTISIKKIPGNRVQYLGRGLHSPDVSILFKNLDCAMMVFLGLIGTPQAAAERRFVVHGNIADSTRVARTLAIVQAFLFPEFVVRATYRRPPKMGLGDLSIKMAICLALLPGLAIRAFR